jgi:hypothetical protein
MKTEEQRVAVELNPNRHLLKYSGLSHTGIAVVEQEDIILVRSFPSYTKLFLDLQTEVSILIESRITSDSRREVDCEETIFVWNNVWCQGHSTYQTNHQNTKIATQKSEQLNLTTNFTSSPLNDEASKNSSLQRAKNTSILRNIRTRNSCLRAKVDDEQYRLAENPRTADKVILTLS